MGDLLRRHTLYSVCLPLYLVEVQIDPLEADSSLVAHGDQHRIWILKPRTLCSLRRHQNKQPLNGHPHPLEQMSVSLKHLLTCKLISCILEYLSCKMVPADTRI